VKVSDTVKAAWIVAGASVVAAGIAAIAALWAPKDKVELPKVSIALQDFDGESKFGENDSSTEIERSENSLAKIFIGMGRSYANSLFGAPVVELNHEFDDTIELNYRFERFYLQLVFNKSGSLNFYSVVSRNKDFTPCIPKLEKCIGENTFSQMAEIEGLSGTLLHTYLYSYLTSKHYGYGEYLYLGNAGDFHNYYLGYNSLGADFSNIVPFTKFGKNDSEWKLFRAKHKPNSFGVGDMSSIDDDNLYYEIGPEYYTFRNR
jgi:hypothetical protein